MQAIRTKYVAANHKRDKGIQAKCAEKTIHWPYNDALDPHQNHHAACEALMREMGWKNDMVGGWYDGDFFWVFANSAYPRTNISGK